MHCNSTTSVYPFGMIMPGRSYDGGSEYRYGFQGMEKDEELAGGSSYDFGARMYDARIGRWFKSDAAESMYPNYSTYCFVADNPIINMEVDGNYWVIFTQRGGEKHQTYIIRISDPEAIEAADNWGIIPGLGWGTFAMKASLAAQDPSLSLGASDAFQVIGAGIYGTGRKIMSSIGRLSKIDRAILEAFPLLGDLTLDILDNPEYAELKIEKQVLFNLALMNEFHQDVGSLQYNDENALIEGFRFSSDFTDQLYNQALLDLSFTDADMSKEANQIAVDEHMRTLFTKMMDTEKAKVMEQVLYELQEFECQQNSEKDEG